MSDVKEEKFTPAADIEAQAASWLQRRRYWSWSDDDQVALEAWLDESLAHSIAYWRLDAGLGRAERLAALRNPAPDQARLAFSGQDSQPRNRIFPTLTRIAVALAVAAVLGAATALFLLRPHDRTFSTPVGGHETVAFADGSKIELNTDTVLRTRMTTEQRVVWLDKGEAYFQVKHDPVHPFIVIAGDRRVTDLGTAFVMRRDSARLKVAVMQGRVWFDASNRQKPLQSALLTPGDVATATAGAMLVTKDTDRALKTNLSWRHGVLIFKYTPLADAAAEFNRYNRQKLVVADPAVAQLTIYGTFPTNNVELFSRVVRDVLGLHVRANGDDIVISH
ncbi:MAG TPA: FecR domain-containing protein [Rhizomicrobium sp.]|nr:FecR domain-containing protein [Rhizomicrobium sp.]